MGSFINKAAFFAPGEQIWLGELYGETKQSMQQFWNNSQLPREDVAIFVPSGNDSHSY